MTLLITSVYSGFRGNGLYNETSDCPMPIPFRNLWDNMYPSQNEACIVFDPISSGVFL